MTEKIYIDRELANELAYDSDCEGYEVVYNKQYDSGRWEAYCTLVIKRKSDNRLFGTDYAVGLTECQERDPFERFDANDEDKIEFVEYKEVEKVVTVYVPALG